MPVWGQRFQLCVVQLPLQTFVEDVAQQYQGKRGSANSAVCQWVQVGKLATRHNLCHQHRRLSSTTRTLEAITQWYHNFPVM